MDTQNKPPIRVALDTTTSKNDRQAIVDAIGQAFTITDLGGVHVNRGTTPDIETMLHPDRARQDVSGGKKLGSKIIDVMTWPDSSDLSLYESAKQKLTTVAEQLAKDDRIYFEVFLTFEQGRRYIIVQVASDKTVTVEEKTLPEPKGHTVIQMAPLE